MISDLWWNNKCRRYADKAVDKLSKEEVEMDEKMDPSQEREMLKKNVNNPAQSQKAKELMKKRIAHLSKKEEVEVGWSFR